MLVVKRWTRYGKDRLYVETDRGEKVGWIDLLTDVATVERNDLADAFYEAVAAYRAAQVTTEPLAAPVLVSDPPPRAPAEPEPSLLAPATLEWVQDVAWRDLALNRPGQAVRAEADLLLADMKSRSKVGTFFKRALDVKTDERAFRVGAAGEEAVGPRLERLVERGWYVLHSIPVGERGSDIDHLLIGPGGVYTVNTKNHPGGKVWVGEHAVRVNGQPTKYLPKSRYEAERVRKLLLKTSGLDLEVRPVLVFLTGTVIPQVTIKQRPADVLILDRMDVPRAFKRAPERLAPQIVQQVYEVARRSTTWC